MNALLLVLLLAWPDTSKAAKETFDVLSLSDTRKAVQALWDELSRGSRLDIARDTVGEGLLLYYPPKTVGGHYTLAGILYHTPSGEVYGRSWLQIWHGSESADHGVTNALAALTAQAKIERSNSTLPLARLEGIVQAGQITINDRIIECKMTMTLTRVTARGPDVIRVSNLADQALFQVRFVEGAQCAEAKSARVVADIKRP